jgi:hypothetical protein
MRRREERKEEKFQRRSEHNKVLGFRVLEMRISKTKNG